MSMHAIEPRSAMSLNIPPEFERAVRERVESGKYESTDDVLKACIDALQEREASEVEDLEELRRQIQVGIDQFDRGEYSDGREAFARIRERLRQRAAR